MKLLSLKIVVEFKNPTLTKIAKKWKNGLEISKEIFLNYFNLP